MRAYEYILVASAGFLNIAVSYRAIGVEDTVGGQPLVANEVTPGDGGDRGRPDATAVRQSE